MALTDATVSCISQCVAGGSPVVAGVHTALIATAAFSLFALVLFGRRLPLKANFFLKSLFLSAFFVLLISLFVASLSMDAAGMSFFHVWHTMTLLFVVALFSVSFFLAPFIMQLQLRREHMPEVNRIVSEEAGNLGMKAPSVFVYLDHEPRAFAVSSVFKRIFLSSALVERLSEGDLRLVAVHELMHLKSGFFNIKRFLKSVKSSFFGLLPIHLDELDILEELKVEKKMCAQGMNLRSVRDKL